MKAISAVCQSCGNAFSAEPKRTFLGFQKLICPSCKAKVIYPLTKGYRITYWVIFTLMLLTIISSFAQGGVGLPGGLGIAVMIALARDWSIQRKVAVALSSSTSTSAPSPSIAHPATPSRGGADTLPGDRRQISPQPQPATSASPPMSPPNKQQLEEELYSAALAELDTGTRRLGLWAKCYAATNSAEPEAKAMYLRERVQQLQAALDETHEAEAAQQAAADRQAREAVEEIKKAFLVGSQPTADQVRQLVAAAEDDHTLARLWERVRGNTLLHWAARHDLVAESRRLLELGADPCAGNAKAQRPHMVAPSQELRDMLFAEAAKR